jgi:hypothetical protein
MAACGIPVIRLDVGTAPAMPLEVQTPASRPQPQVEPVRHVLTVEQTTTVGVKWELEINSNRSR